jgi:hypothetical protein
MAYGKTLKWDRPERMVNGAALVDCSSPESLRNLLRCCPKTINAVRRLPVRLIGDFKRRRATTFACTGFE